MKRVYVESIAVGLVLTALSYVVGAMAGWVTPSMDPMFLLEIFAVATSFSCTYLCVKQSRMNYPIGAITTAAYAYIFWNAGLMSSAALNLYLVPALLYGWFRWRPDEITRPVTRLGWDRWTLGYGVITVLGYVFVVSVTKYFGAELPFLDTAILVLTILAQVLLDNKKLETWIVWVWVNLLAIYVYWEAGLVLVTFQYVLFLLNTFYGFHNWVRSYHDDADREALSLAEKVRSSA